MHIAASPSWETVHQSRRSQIGHGRAVVVRRQTSDIPPSPSRLDDDVRELSDLPSTIGEDSVQVSLDGIEPQLQPAHRI